MSRARRLLLAASAIHDVIDGGDGVRRFTLPAGHAEALLDEESLDYVSPFGRLQRTAEASTAPADDLERLHYGFGILHCLPAGMVGEGAVGTGTVMRPAMVEAHAREAGFATVEIAAIENDFWRFSVLRP